MSEDKQEVLMEKVREFEALKAIENAPVDSENTSKILSEKRILGPAVAEKDARREMSRRSRRTFLTGGAAALIGVLGWRWMGDETKQNLLRRTFEFNEKVSQMFYRPQRLAPEFARANVQPLRVNGGIGLPDGFDASSWQLSVGGLAGRTDDLLLTIEDIRKLPRTEMTTELKCIEGWSAVVNWAGVRFSDFTAAYLPQTRDQSEPDILGRPQDLVRYVSLVTPNKEYFVGWDMPSILHPQTLLAYEMNGEPLRPEHGAPLRLASPTKYGIKLIKQIGRIEYTDIRPRDYWAEQGYDWYSGH